ncbi:MAG TPA: chorismate mutase, partial [Cyclobacteriaceae bacterium]|nr:chorismate mutase [Cyclobacteriaceae bacterium]
PSHIAGERSLILEISQRAADLDFDGLMIETHPDPDKAWSDPKQQVTPVRLGELLKEIKFRKSTSRNREFITQLEEMREQIDHLDQELFEILSARMRIVDQIGYYKRDNNVAIFQKNRWKEISETRGKWAQMLGLNAEFTDELFKLIHENAIRRQAEILNEEKKKKNG